MDYEEQVYYLSTNNVHSTALLKLTDLAMSQEVIPTEIIQFCVNILNSNKMTPKEQALRYFTTKKLEE